MAIRDSLFSLKFWIKCHTMEFEDSCISRMSRTTFLSVVSKVGTNQVFLISKSYAEAFVVTDDSEMFQSPGISAVLALSLYLELQCTFWLRDIISEWLR